MHLATMGNLYDITKFCHSVVPGQLDAVRLVKPCHLFGILAVVYYLQLCEEDYTPTGLPVQGWVEVGRW